MKKMTKTEMRQVNGGTTYRCRTGKCRYTTKNKVALGWHFILFHTIQYDLGNCAYSYSD